MLLWSQQIDEISSVFFSFQKGEKVRIKSNPKSQKNDSLFLNPSKFENMTLSNFKILLYYYAFNERIPSKVRFLERLDGLTKEEINKSLQLKSDILSYRYIIKKDLETLETLDISPYEAYKRKLIHPFTLWKFYSGKEDQSNTREMKKDLKMVKVLMSYFNLN